MSRKSSLLVLLFSLLLAGSLLAGMVIHRTDSDGAAPYRQIGIMTEVYQHINDDYVTTPDLAKVTDGGLHGLLESLDGDSSYLSPSEYAAYEAAQRQPAQGDIGAVIEKRGGYADVVDVEPGSPATQAGLVRGDFVEAVDDTSTREISLVEINRKIAGAPGSTVTLSVVHLHRSDPVKVTVTRAMPTTPPLEVSNHDGVGIVHPSDLNPGRAAQIAAALASLRQQGAAKLILDLRNCGEGSFAEASQVANLFLDHGTITYLEGQRVPRVTTLADPAKAVAPKMPLEVLVNIGTSGPAEVVAAAVLQDGRGDVIGDHTFGEGSLQKLIPVGDGSAVMLSIARYYTPNGKPVEDGIAPNIAQVQYAGALPDADYPPEGVGGTQPDLQMQKALDLMRAKS